MVDITVTPGSVVQGAGANVESGVAGATITAGQAVYLDATSGRYKLADSDSGTAAARTAKGIALNSASDGQPLSIQVKGDITIGATVVANTAYYLSNTAGGICPLADVGAGEFMQLIGIGISATQIRMGLLATGVAN